MKAKVIIMTLCLFFLFSLRNKFDGFWEEYWSFREQCYEILAPVYDEDNGWIMLRYFAESQGEFIAQVDNLEAIYGRAQEYFDVPLYTALNDEEDAVYTQLNFMRWSLSQFNGARSFIVEQIGYDYENDPEGYGKQTDLNNYFQLKSIVSLEHAEYTERQASGSG